MRCRVCFCTARKKGVKVWETLFFVTNIGISRLSTFLHLWIYRSCKHSPPRPDALMTYFFRQKTPLAAEQISSSLYHSFLPPAIATNKCDLNTHLAKHSSPIYPPSAFYRYSVKHQCTVCTGKYPESSPFLESCVIVLDNYTHEFYTSISQYKSTTTTIQGSKNLGVRPKIISFWR